MGSPFENARLQAKQSPRRERKEPSLLGLVAQQSGRGAHTAFGMMSECIQKWENDGKGQFWISLAQYQAIKPAMPGLLWETADSQGAPAERMEPAEDDQG